MHRTPVLAAALCVALGLTALVGAPPAAADSQDVGALRRKVEGALRARRPDAAVEAIQALGSCDSRRAADFLATLGKVGNPEVYQAAVAALAGMDSQEVQSFVLERLGRDGGNVLEKMILIDAMARRAETHSGDAFAGKALGAALHSHKDEVQRAALAAIKQARPLKAVDGLIDLLASLERKDPDGLNATLTREALRAITKQSFDRAQDWRNWWEPRKATFTPPAGDPKPRAGSTRLRKRPHFFGSEIKSDRVVFVIDTSGSMTAVDGSTGEGNRARIERAKRQLSKVIDELPDDARFTIMAFSGALVMGPRGPQLPPGTPQRGPLPPKIGGYQWLKVWSPHLQHAGSAAKASAKRFVSQLKAAGGTFTLDALQEAFQVEGANSIVLLSDGLPNDVNRATGSILSGDQILAAVRTLNRAKRWVIDAFGFDPAAGGGGARPGGFRHHHHHGSRARPMGGFGGFGGMGGGAPPGLSDFMQKLADQNGGDYTQIQ